MITSLHDRRILNDNTAIPGIGFGVFKINEGEDVVRSVLWALETGYRLIDTASSYGNEKGVGQAIRESGIKREEIYLTTKLWNADQGDEKVITACDMSLNRLGLDYIDQYLIHWPGKNANRRIKSWEAILMLKEQKLIRSAGVSNSSATQIQELIDASGVIPAINQIEVNPLNTQKSMLDFARSKGIAISAWAPLLRGHLGEYPQISEIAQKYGKSEAQVVLRWHLQNGIIPLPKSSNKERIRQNVEIFDFVLNESDILALDALNQDKSSVDLEKLNTIGFE